MSNSVSFVVITPEREVLSGEADAVVIPAHDGELGVLPRRAPLMCELGVGEFRFRQGAATFRLFVDGGFAQVYDNRVTILTSRACKADEVTDELIRSIEQVAEDADPAARSKAARRSAVLRGLKSAG